MGYAVFVGSLTEAQKQKTALAGLAQCIEHGPENQKGSLFWFPVQAHAFVVGQLPSRGHARGDHTLMFPSLPPLPSV